jgi:RNA polymerase sigma factor (sigma-70 family)
VTDPTTTLIRDHAHLARSIAAGFKRRLPPHFMMDDLHAAAMCGLWDAARRNPDCDDFERYARVRIRGAIRDDLRSRDWLPRNARKNELLSLVQVVVDTDHPSMRDARSSVDVESRVRAARAQAKLEALLGLLPWRERHIFISFHFEGISFKTVAEELGLTEARISQIHSGVISKLRRSLEEDLDI